MMLDTVNEAQEQLDAVEPYAMHVSSRYLELTKRKLESTRLPRELELPEQRRWELGVPKAVLEPLLDYWLEQYDWRTQETHFNTSLPQYRTKIQLLPSNNTNAPTQSLRVHFVHKPSKHKNAIPLLFCHTWPASFIEIQKTIDALTDPHSLPSFGAGAQQAFHVVAPSIPGFGFSDASSMGNLGLEETAYVFHSVMQRLGYDRYVAHGTGWGFSICRALALHHSPHCLAIHTTNPSFEEPTLKHSPVVYLKHRIARWTRAKLSPLSFGYTPAEVAAPIIRESAMAHGQGLIHGPAGATLSPIYTLRPQTLAYSLCDSPVGLLAGLLDIIHTHIPSLSPVTSRPRSPFLSPVELEMEDAQRTQTDNEIHSTSVEQLSTPFNPHDSETNARSYTWSPTEVLDWTMLQWLPGPEASLRWLRRATLDASPSSPLSTSYCDVPLGISCFQARNTHSAPGTPVMWGSASWRIAWVKRHQRSASISPAWEAPDLLVLDMRECFGGFLSSGILNLPFQES